MTDIETKSQALATLDSRLAAGEIGGDEYERLRALLTSGLTPDQCARLGVTQTPAPGTVSGLRMGPSGGQTRMPTIAELELEPGTVLLGQWRIVRELGRGGFGAVYEAEDIKLNRTVAMKVLDPAMVAREELLARFRREVTLMRELAHERIVRVFDYREELSENLALITMEYVGGCSVRGLLALARASKEQVSIDLALAIFEQTLEALAAAHARGVIHRDVTPGNILLAGGRAAELLSDPKLDPRIKLVDFGIAGLVERTELSAKSRMLGTAAYVAPEVLDPDAEITPEADVFGAGAVVYELLTGKTPMVTGYRPVKELRDDVPPSLAEVINNATRPVPEGRPSPMKALRALIVFHAQKGDASRKQEGSASAHICDFQSERKLDEVSQEKPSDAPPEVLGLGSDSGGPMSSGDQWLASWWEDVRKDAKRGRWATPAQRRKAVAQGLKAAGRWLKDISLRRKHVALGLRDVAQWMTRRWGTDWKLMRDSVVWGLVSWCLWRIFEYIGLFHHHSSFSNLWMSEIFLIVTILGIAGTIWGFGQWLSLRRTIKIPPLWIASTSIAFMVFGALFDFQFSVFPRSFSYYLFFFVMAAPILGAFQARLLRNRVANWALWIPAQILLFPLCIFMFGILGGVGQGLLLSYLKANYHRENERMIAGRRSPPQTPSVRLGGGGSGPGSAARPLRGPAVSPMAAGVVLVALVVVLVGIWLESSRGWVFSPPPSPTPVPTVKAPTATLVQSARTATSTPVPTVKAPTATPVPSTRATTSTRRSVAPQSAYYPLDGNAEDASGNGNHGTMRDGSWATGYSGGALAVTNGTKSAVSIPRNVFDGFGNTAYVEAWVNPTGLPLTAGTIFRKRGAYNDWDLSQTPDGRIVTNISGYVGTGGMNGWQGVGVTSPESLPLNTWTKVSSWYDGSTLTLSINGVPVASVSKTLPLVWDSPLCPGDRYYENGCYYGTWIGSVSTYSRTSVDGSYTFNGKIDEVWIATGPGTT